MTTTGVLTALARTPGWPRWTAASFFARWPVTMTLVALVLAGEVAAGSLAVGAQLAGVATAANGLAAPWRGRRLDRGELNAGLRRATASGAVAFAALAVAVGVAAPLPVLFVLAAATGVALAGVNGGFRSLLQAVVPGAQLPRALTVEAVFVEVAFVTGPALAGLLAWVVNPTLVLVIMAVSAATSSMLLARLPRLEPPDTRPAAAAWQTPNTWPVFTIAAGLGIAVGAYEAALPERLVHLGTDPEHAGTLLAALAVGSALGGVVAARRDDVAARPRALAFVLLAGLGLPLTASAAVGSPLPLAAVLLIAGAPIAPLNALGAILLQRRVPAGRRSEGFAVYVAAVILGAGSGQLLTGMTLEAVGPTTVMFGAGSVPVLLAGAVLASGLRARRASTKEREDQAELGEVVGDHDRHRRPGQVRDEAVPPDERIGEVEQHRPDQRGDQAARARDDDGPARRDEVRRQRHGELPRGRHRAGEDPRTDQRTERSGEADAEGESWQ